MDSLKKMFKNLPSKIFYFCFDGFLPIKGLILAKIYNKKLSRLSFFHGAKQRSMSLPRVRKISRSYVIFALKALIFIIVSQKFGWSRYLQFPKPLTFPIHLWGQMTHHIKALFQLCSHFFRHPSAFPK